MGETLSVAETTTGGLISASIIAVPGSSAYYDRGIVAYSKASKIESLGIPEGRLAELGAVSPETAELLAISVRKMAGTTYGLAETGIAGPIAGRSPKPIGTAHVAFAGPRGVRTMSLQLEGDRQEIQRSIAQQAVSFALACLQNGDKIGS
jgi:PncC family amidohydrolase